MNRLVVISGCSSGGKSTLVNEMSNRGYEIVEEPGRRIIAEERQRGGNALPWKDVEAYLRRAIDLARNDIAELSGTSRWAFCDRGLVDAAAGLAHITGEPISTHLGSEWTYHRKVFLAPPWPEIYVNDEERRHPLFEAVQEYERLLGVYPSVGYEVVILPKTDVRTRADFVLRHLGE